jgi:hypothetical protein
MSGKTAWNGLSSEQEERKRKKEGDADEERDNEDNQMTNDEEGAENEDDDTQFDWSDYSIPDDLVMTDMLCLATGYESGGRNIVLDVFAGVIHEDMIRCDMLSGVWVESWFEDMRDKFERLEYVPVRGELYENVSDIENEEEESEGEHEGKRWDRINRKFGWSDEEHQEAEDEGKQFKRIYRKFVWPGEGYRKNEALAAVEVHRQNLEDTC